MDINALRSSAGPASFSAAATRFGFTANRTISQLRHSWAMLSVTK